MVSERDDNRPEDHLTTEPSSPTSALDEPSSATVIHEPNPTNSCDTVVSDPLLKMSSPHNDPESTSEWEELNPVHPILLTQTRSTTSPGSRQDDTNVSLRPHLQPSLMPGTLSLSSAPSSTHTSSSSLHALSEEPEPDRAKSQPVQRAYSIKSPYGAARKRGVSHSKAASASHSTTTNNDYPIYPDQSFSVLQPQPRSARPHPFLRTHSSNPSQDSLSSELSMFQRSTRDRPHPNQGARTAGNTPVSSPGLFSPHLARPPTSAATHDLETPHPASPRLHPTHLQTPKETHTVEIEHDTFTGNKFINNYEILEQLGRGQYGKVKKGRDIENDIFVAIKIVPRYSRQRRLGKLGAEEDRVRKEVAILKKARHQNVVSLLEVIDDPSRHKVYIVLEYVEHGEIRWRTPGIYTEILSAYRTHLWRERSKIPETADLRAQDLHIISKAQRSREQRLRQQARTSTADAATHPSHFSLEYGEANDDDDSVQEMTRSISRLTDRSVGPGYSSPQYEGEHGFGYGLEGTMYGPYIQEPTRARAWSIADSTVSQMSSEFNLEDDDENGFVPTLTLEEARIAFRDTLLGLEFLHFQGIIHRDIKPANLLVASNGHVKISDFGVSYLGRPVNDEEENKVGETEAKTLDDPRELARTVGTPAFYAPELCSEDPTQFAEDVNGPRITGAIDLWALGITLYAMIYGRLPFYADDHMGLYQAICEADVFMPRFRLVAAQYIDNASAKPNSQLATELLNEQPMANKRLHREYELEEVPENIRNLIRSLLIKDSTRRMTIENAKMHSWVLEGIHDPERWRAKTNPKAEGKSRIVVDDKDVSYGVIKRSLVERAISGVSRIAGTFLGRRESRRRAPSSATSANASAESIPSTSLSSGSTVGKDSRTRESRRTSLRGDEIVAAALKASREGGDHPLAQSQTASPEAEDGRSYFGDFTANIKAASTGATPAAIEERRPRGPERAISAVSNAESTKTIRASQVTRRPSTIDSSQSSFESQNLLDGTSTNIGSIFSGAGRRLAGMRSRERRPLDRNRSPSSQRTSSSSDAHASPSLAISTASASGGIEAPDALRPESPPPDKVSLHLSPISPSQLQKQFYYQPPVSSDAAWGHAHEVNQRKYLNEAVMQAQKETSFPSKQGAEHDCPPSPDDEFHFQRSMTTYDSTPHDGPLQTLPSASTIASSSLDGMAGGMSQSTSNPSIPSVVSEASSLATDSFFPPDKGYLAGYGADTEPAFMRTAETLKARDEETPVFAAGRPLEEQEAFDDGDDEDESSEDEGIMFGRSAKKLTKE